jgi:hypothetical protein
VTVSFPPIVDRLGPIAAYAADATAAALFLIFVWRWVKETRGTTLEEA